MIVIKNKRISIRKLAILISFFVIFSLVMIMVLLAKTLCIYGILRENPAVNVNWLITLHVLSVLLITSAYLFTMRKFYFFYEGDINIDHVSGISNVNKFIDDVERLLKNKEGLKLALAHYDIDKFKMINDTFGYSVGDEIIRNMGNELTRLIGSKYVYGHSDGDNFMVLLTSGDSELELLKKIKRISASLEEMDVWKVLKIKPVITTGIYFVEEDDLEARKAIDMAKMAKKSIKGRYKSAFAIYNKKIKNKLVEEKRIEDEMYDALTDRQFKVYYQPKINLKTGELSGAEALVRWEHPVLGVLRPSEFIPIFEKNGFITKLDRYVFEELCCNMREWLDKGCHVVPMSVNVSRLHFKRMDFVERYKSIKEKYLIPDGLVEIEITESVVFGYSINIVSVMKDFKRNGFKISMDDFGSGYSSLGLLKDMPIDTLKLDRVFLKDMEDYNSQIIISNIISLAQKLNLTVVSEGVENQLQVNFLREAGCDMAQGYIFAKPMTVCEYEKLLSRPVEKAENMVLCEAT